MSIIEKLEREKLTTNFFNILGEYTGYTGRAFNYKELSELTKRKLKEQYPNLTDEEINAFCSISNLTSDDFMIKENVLIDNSLLIFVSDRYASPNNIHSQRIVRVNRDKPYYRSITSEHFKYNYDASEFYRNAKNRPPVISEPYNAGLSDKESVEYAKLLATALTTFAQDQHIDIKVVASNSRTSTKSEYNDGDFIIDSKENDLFLLLDGNFINLGLAYAYKEPVIINLIILKGADIILSARLSQYFDELGNCVIKITNNNKKYLNLNAGYKEIKAKDTKKTIVSNKKDKKTIIPYPALLVDEDIKDELIANNIVIPITTIPSSANRKETIEYIRAVANSYSKSQYKPLVISKDQHLIIAANHLGLDTCFINTYSNDLYDYKTTYEVNSVDDIKKLKI